MKLRFTTSVASALGSFVEGRVIEVAQPEAEVLDWLRSGVVVPIPDTDPELTVAPRAVEQAVTRRKGEARSPSPDGKPTVPIVCPGGTVVCLGCGPSLTADDVDACRDQVDGAVAVNDSYRLAPWATALYAADARWWRWHAAMVSSFRGLKYTVQPLAKTHVPDVLVLESTGEKGLELAATGLRTGQNGGYQAINLAVHLGATRILLLGYDMTTQKGRPSHWFGEHPDKRRTPYARFIPYFETLVAPLAAIGVSVINCSVETALPTFPRLTLAQALAERRVQALA